MSSENRRQHPRADFPRVRLRFPQGRGYEDQMLQDLSIGGVFAFTDHTLPVGSELDIEILLGEAQEPHRITGRVIRIQLGGDPSGRGMAVEFVDPRPELVEALTRTVESFRQRAGRIAVAPRSGDEPEIELDLDLIDAVDNPVQDKGPNDSNRQPQTLAATDDGEAFAWPIEHEQLGPPSPRAAGAETANAARAATPADSWTGARGTQPLTTTPQTPEPQRAPGVEPHPTTAPRTADTSGDTAATPQATLGPEDIASREDFVEYLVNGARLRTTPRFERLEPVSRFDIQVSDWLKETDRLETIQQLALGRMREEELLGVLHLFFERSLVRITA